MEVYNNEIIVDAKEITDMDISFTDNKKMFIRMACNKCHALIVPKDGQDFLNQVLEVASDAIRHKCNVAHG